VRRTLITLSLAVMLMALGAGPAAAVTRVVDNTPAAKCKTPTPNVPANNFTAIQPAIQASNPNDTVLVCPGTYEELVTIKRNTGGTVLNGLKLSSHATHAAIIKAPGSTTGGDAIVRVSEARTVEVRKFRITGPGPGPCNSIKLGVWVRDNADAKVLNNQVLNVRDEPFSGCQNGSGIQFGSFESGTPDVSTPGDGSAQQNLVSGYQKNGITVNETGSNVLVHLNTTIGAGATGITAQNGIQVGFGAVAKISSNKVEANFYTGVNFASGGIIGVDPAGVGVAISGNVASNNQVNYWAADMDVAQIINNRSTGGEYGFYNDADSTDNKYDRNRSTNASLFDCLDDSLGGGTSGTANTWTRNIGAIASPPGICLAP
jgi:hypothetical protein